MIIPFFRPSLLPLLNSFWYNLAPAFSQGAFYILSQALVEYLFRGHEHLECFTNEDVTIGSWLMGVSARGVIYALELQREENGHEPAINSPSALLES